MPKKPPATPDGVQGTASQERLRQTRLWSYKVTRWMREEYEVEFPSDHEPTWEEVRSQISDPARVLLIRETIKQAPKRKPIKATDGARYKATNKFTIKSRRASKHAEATIHDREIVRFRNQHSPHPGSGE